MRRRHNRQYPQSRTGSAEIKRVETTQGFYTAEAGMNMAIREMMNSTDEDGDGAVDTISDEATPANLHHFPIALPQLRRPTDSILLPVKQQRSTITHHILRLGQWKPLWGTVDPSDRPMRLCIVRFHIESTTSRPTQFVGKEKAPLQLNQRGARFTLSGNMPLTDITREDTKGSWWVKHPS